MDVEDDPEANGFKVVIGPGESAMKSVVAKNLSEGYCYKNTVSYKCRRV